MLLMVAAVGAAATVQPHPDLTVYPYNTDTVQERVNVTEYENDTLKENITGWHYETGQNTYLLNVNHWWTEGNIADKKMDVTVQLDPNNLTKLLAANKEPWKSIDNRTDYFNKHYYFNGSNITSSEFSDLEAEISDLYVYLDGEVVKSTNLKDKPKNVTVKVWTNDSQRIKIGNHSTVVATSGGSDDSYDKYKPVNVTTASGTPSIPKAQPVNWTCGDDSTTGTGQIVLDCSSVDGVEDIDFTNTTDHRLPYEIEHFNGSTGGVAWVWNNWTRDGSEQLRIHYGNGGTDEQDNGGDVG